MKKLLLLLALAIPALAQNITVQKSPSTNELTSSSRVLVVPTGGSITTTGTGVIAATSISPGGAVPWSTITGTPTTLTGYGVTNTLSTTSPLTGGGSLASNLTIAMPAATSSVNGYLTSADWTAFNAKQGAGNYITGLTGDVTAAGPGSSAATLATVASAGTTGSSTAIPVITINVKGLTTVITTAAVVAPAGTLTGTTLASNVVTSSLTSVGTIGSGTWQGTVVAGLYGGTGVANSGKTITLGGNLTTSGAFATTLTATGTTTVTMPTTGTLTTLAGAEALTNKTYNGNTFTAGTGTLTIAAGKVLTQSATLTYTGTDGSSVAFGTGGTVLYSGGSYVSSIAGTANEITASASTGAVTLSLPSALTFTGKTITGGTYSSGAFNGTVGATTAAAGTFTSITNSGLTTGRVVTTTTGGLETSSATLQFTGTFFGIGVATPAYRLDVLRSSTVSNTNEYGAQVYLTPTPSADTDYIVAAINGQNYTLGTHRFGEAVGVFGNLTIGSTDANTKGEAVLGHISTSAAEPGAASELYAFRSSMDHNAANTLGWMIGAYLNQIDVAVGGTITNAAGIVVGTTGGTGFAGARKTNAWGILTMGASDRNNFAGPTRHGTKPSTSAAIVSPLEIVTDTSPTYAMTSGTTALGTTFSLTPAGAIVASSTMSATQLTSTISTGTSPIVVASTTLVTGLYASRADTLATARTINGTSFDGSANVTVTAAAGTLTGATLASGVTASSLTSVGTLTSLTVSGQITSTLATGTAPFPVTSTTVNTNFNAALLNGTTWTAPGAIGATTASTIKGTTITGTTGFDVGSTSPPTIRTNAGSRGNTGSFEATSSTGGRFNFYATNSADAVDIELIGVRQTAGTNIGTVSFYANNSITNPKQYVSLIAQSTTITSGAEDGRLVVQVTRAGTIASTNSTFFADGSLSVAGTTASTSTTTGSLIAAGGLGVAGAHYNGGIISVSDTTEATTGAAGSITTAGGIYAAKKLITASTLTTLGGATFHTTSSALTDGAGASIGTLTNAPAATNPTKWIGINDNGTTRYIPAW